VVAEARLLYSRPMDAQPHGNNTQAPWEVATTLRWKIVRGVLLDPISWLLLAVSAWAIHEFSHNLSQSGGWGGSLIILAALSGCLVFAVTYGDRLLFRESDNDFLRTQPLGDLGFYRLRSEELGWWLRPPALLAAAAGLGVSGWWLALLCAATVAALAPLGLYLALRARRIPGRLRSLILVSVLAAPTLAVYLLADLPLGPSFAPAETWLAAAPACLLLAAAIAGRSAAPSLFRTLFATTASQAAVRDQREMGRLWRIFITFLPLPMGVRSRLTRDLVLLLRGWDTRGSLLLLLSPLSCLYLGDVLSGSMREAALLWRVLESAALGAAAIAYAVGPNIHVLRAEAMSWSRCSPQPGRNELHSALLYAAGFATLHGALILLTVATVRDGRFLAQLPELVLPVLALELFMVHFSVVFSMAESLGRRVAGEGALILALACLAAGLAVVAVIYPVALPLYLLVTLGLSSRARERYESLEVTW
jgi:hypothetical protein